MRHVPAALLLVVGLAGAERLSAIVIRHDVSDDRYRAMAARFPAVGHFGRAGTGTLVGPSWVLTAAHVASRLRSATFTLGERPYAIQNVTLHPDWKAMGPHDIALVRLLAAPANGVDRSRSAVYPPRSAGTEHRGWRSGRSPETVQAPRRREAQWSG